MSQQWRGEVTLARSLFLKCAVKLLPPKTPPLKGTTCSYCNSSVSHISYRRGAKGDIITDFKDKKMKIKLTCLTQKMHMYILCCFVFSLFHRKVLFMYCIVERWLSCFVSGFCYYKIKCLLKVNVTVDLCAQCAYECTVFLKFNCLIGRTHGFPYFESPQTIIRPMLSCSALTLHLSQLCTALIISKQLVKNGGLLLQSASVLSSTPVNQIHQTW